MQFTEVKEIFAGERGEYLSFLRIIKDDAAEAREILARCATSFSHKAYGDLKHNLISTMRVFSLNELDALFEQGKTALEENDEAGFKTIISQAIAAFSAFEVELERELGESLA